MKKNISLKTIQIESAPNPTATIIWLHGLNADGSNLMPVAKKLDLSVLSPIRFIFPTAPRIPVTINGGCIMYAWYDIFNMHSIYNEDEISLHTSQTALEDLINIEIMRGIKTSRIILAGFSQGCAMSLYTGLCYKKQLAGLICLSGYLPISHKFSAEHNLSNKNIPIFMAHGIFDQVIILKRAEQSRDLLKSFGYKISWHTYSMQHSICIEEINDIEKWLKNILN